MALPELNKRKQAALNPDSTLPHEVDTLTLPYSGFAVAVFYNAEGGVIETVVSESVSIEEVSPLAWFVSGFGPVPSHCISVELTISDGMKIRKLLKNWLLEAPFSFSLG